MYSMFQNMFTFYGLCLALISTSVSSSLTQNMPKSFTSSSLCNQRPPRHFQSLSNPELRDFIRSFDTVIIDIVAIIRQSSSPSVAVEILKNFQNCNKKLIFLLNDSVFPVQNYIHSLSSHFNFHVNESQFLLPHETLLWYLKKNRLNPKTLVIGSDQLIRKLKDAGIDVLPAIKYCNANNYHRQNVVAIDKRVGRVVVDIDIASNLGQIVQAGLYLKNENTQFLAGTAQKEIYMDKFHKIIGPSYFEDILTNYTGRIPLHYGKPGGLMKDYIMERFPAIAADPSKVLFIGSSLDVDMKYAYMCGFQKLWIDPHAHESIVSGQVKDCMITPNYYLPDISKMRFVGCRQ